MLEGGGLKTAGRVFVSLPGTFFRFKAPAQAQAPPGNTSRPALTTPHVHPLTVPSVQQGAEPSRSPAKSNTAVDLTVFFPLYSYEWIFTGNFYPVIGKPLSK